MRQKDILSPQEGEDKQKTAWDDEEDQKGEEETKNKWEEGMNVLQPYDGDIPDEKNEKEENETSED